MFVHVNVHTAQFYWSANTSSFIMVQDLMTIPHKSKTNLTAGAAGGAVVALG